MSHRFSSKPSLLETAILARDISSVPWADTCRVSQDEGKESYDKNVSEMTQELFALFAIRLLAILHKRGQIDPLLKFSDLSTTSICETIIRTKIPLDWPEQLTLNSFNQLYDYIFKLLEMYRSVSYHNRYHAYHVTVSAHKLLDLLLCESDWTLTISLNPIKKPTRPSYGIKKDPLVQLAFLFSALIHDVDHTGISNRQLVMESDELALMYNDQSVAEQRSLAVAFSLFREDTYNELRFIVFQPQEDYIHFRKIVIDLVLCTDIASPERVQIVKSKWKEAFGDVKNIRHYAGTSTQESPSILFDSFSSTTHSDLFRGSSNSMKLGASFNSFRRQSNGSSVRWKDSEDEVHVQHSHGRKNSAPDTSTNIPPPPPIRKGGFLKNIFKMRNRRNSSQRKDRQMENVETSKTIISSDLYNTSTCEKSGPDDIVHVVTVKENLQEVSTLPFLPNEQVESTDTLKIDSTLNENREDDISVASKSSSIFEAPNLPSSKLILLPNKATRKEQDLSARRSKSLDINFDKRMNEVQTEDFLLDVKNDGKNVTDASSVAKHSEGSSSSDKDHKSSLVRKIFMGHRFSEPTVSFSNRSKFHVKLGIRRALDLTGSQIETYRSFDKMESDPDQPDELKMMVTLEQMIKSADVSANMQDWNTMLAWTRRLFNEQMQCFIHDHGPNPQNEWHGNQIAFFESYTLPLACRLVDTHVFELEAAGQFVNGVRQNNIRWMIEGNNIVESMIQDWDKRHAK